MREYILSIWMNSMLKEGKRYVRVDGGEAVLLASFKTTRISLPEGQHTVVFYFIDKKIKSLRVNLTKNTGIFWEDKKKFEVTNPENAPGYADDMGIFSVRYTLSVKLKRYAYYKKYFVRVDGGEKLPLSQKSACEIIVSEGRHMVSLYNGEKVLRSVKIDMHRNAEILVEGILFSILLTGDALGTVEGKCSHATAKLLAILFGTYGAHRFYLGYKKDGRVMLALWLCFLVCLISLINYSTIGSEGDIVICLLTMPFALLGIMKYIWDIVLISKYTLRPADGTTYKGEPTFVRREAEATNASIFSANSKKESESAAQSIFKSNEE